MAKREVAELCPERYIYCAMPIGMSFPQVDGVPSDWYAHKKFGQLEFRKYVNDKRKCKECGRSDVGSPYSGWMVKPVLCLPDSGIADETKEFTEFEMKDKEVLSLWQFVVSVGGVVSDGYINLFS